MGLGLPLVFWGVFLAPEFHIHNKTFHQLLPSTQAELYRSNSIEKHPTQLVRATFYTTHLGMAGDFES